MVGELLLKTLGQLWLTFANNWPYLLAGILVAAAMKVFVDQEKVGRWLHKYRNGSIFASTGVAVSTPLCSCGTMAVILSMMASSIPWAPIVAFMVASPLTSPGELIYSAGLFGWRFALTYFAAAIGLGLTGGFLAKALEARGWLANQARFRPVAGGSGLDAGQDLPVPAVAAPAPRPGVREYLAEVWSAGRRLLLLFTLYAFIGYFLNNLIPATWVTAMFGSGKSWGVPVAATLGLPLYLNSEASLPLVRTFIETGVSPGAAMAFLITGAGTSVGAIGGALTIARWRVVGLVIGTLWVGAIIFGYAYNAILATGLF